MRAFFVRNELYNNFDRTSNRETEILTLSREREREKTLRNNIQINTICIIAHRLPIELVDWLQVFVTTMNIN